MVVHTSLTVIYALTKLYNRLIMFYDVDEHNLLISCIFEHLNILVNNL